MHRYALFVAAIAFAAIVAGAYVTSSEVAAHGSQAPAAVGIGEDWHQAVSIALGILTLGLAIWTWFAGTSTSPKSIAAAAFVVYLADSALGWPGPPLSAGLAIFHALLGHLFLAALVALAVLTSQSWSREAEPIAAGKWTSLRPLAIATPPVVLLQITMGAMYRHDVAGIMPHMGGAMLVALMTLVLSAVVLQNFPGPPPLRRAATALISLVLAQVCLGIAAFLMLVLNATGTPAFIFSASGHVAIGSATLAASIAMAMQVRHSIRQ